MTDVTESQKWDELLKVLAIPDAIKEIPKIDGNNFGELKNYIETVNEILEVIGDIINLQPQGKLMLRAIRNKIIGDGNQHLINFQIPLIWDEIEQALWDYFYHYKKIDNEHICNKDIWLTKQELLQR